MSKSGRLVRALCALGAAFIGVSTLDPATYAGFTAALLIAVFAACCGPGLRAARVDSVISLRRD